MVSLLSSSLFEFHSTVIVRALYFGGLAHRIWEVDCLPRWSPSQVLTTICGVCSVEACACVDCFAWCLVKRSILVIRVPFISHRRWHYRSQLIPTMPWLTLTISSPTVPEDCIDFRNKSLKYFRRWGANPWPLASQASALATQHPPWIASFLLVTTEHPKHLLHIAWCDNLEIISNFRLEIQAASNNAPHSSQQLLQQAHVMQTYS